jgi:hypothetical protein
MMTDTQFRDTIKTLLAAFGSNDPAQRQEARAKIRNTLAANRKSWNDLMAILHFGGKHGEKLKKLFAMLGQDNDGEFDNARQKVSDLLAGPQRTWEAFVDSLFSVPSNSWSEWHTDTASYGDINPLDVVHHLLQRYVELTAHQFVAVSLWIMAHFRLSTIYGDAAADVVQSGSRLRQDHAPRPRRGALCASVEIRQHHRRQHLSRR